jgi:hypothetical protein
MTSGTTVDPSINGKIDLTQVDLQSKHTVPIQIKILFCFLQTTELPSLSCQGNLTIAWVHAHSSRDPKKMSFATPQDSLPTLYFNQPSLPPIVLKS